MEEDLSSVYLSHLCNPGLNEVPFVVQELACGLLFYWLVSAEGRGQLCLAVVEEEEGAGPKKIRRSTLT